MRTIAKGDWDGEESPEPVRMSSLLAVPLAAIFGTTLSVWAWHFLSSGSTPSSIASEPARIAVLPFHGYSRSPEAERLDKELTDSLVILLARSAQVQALPADTNADPLAVGRVLHTDVMLIGLVRNQGERVSVKVQIVSTRDASQLWSGEFNGETRDIAGIAALISNSVASHLTALLD